MLAPGLPFRLLERGRRLVRRVALRGVQMARVGGWPAGPEVSGRLEEALEDAASSLEGILEEAILPFWRARVIDRDQGGYHLHHDLVGADLGPAGKHIIGQTRTLWFFSRLVRSRWSVPGDLEAARHGFEHLSSTLWDRRHGGFVWEVAWDGAPVHPHKHALAQASAILALTEYWKASGEGAPLDLASRTFEVWDRAAHDPADGGYVEMHRADWSSADGLEGYWALDPGLRMLDTQLHIGEGLAALYAVDPSPRLAARIAEQLRIVTARRAGFEQGVMAFRPGWSPSPVRRVEFGFDAKRIVLIHTICSLAGFDDGANLEGHREIFEAVMAFGWDRRDGGVFEAGRPGRPASELHKSWWTQAETLRSALLLWRLTGDAKYLKVFLGTLRWIARWQVDRDRGGSYEIVDRHRRPSGRKAWAWKAPFHLPRAILDCLGELEGRPG